LISSKALATVGKRYDKADSGVNDIKTIFSPKKMAKIFALLT
jgi:hypothetical protein